jgi:predicted transcriptional regulator
MKPTKAMTIRLSAEQAEALETVARVQDLAISDVIRSAIEGHINERKKDPLFRDGLKDRIEKAQRLLAR